MSTTSEHDTESTSSFDTEDQDVHNHRRSEDEDEEEDQSRSLAQTEPTVQTTWPRRTTSSTSATAAAASTALGPSFAQSRSESFGHHIPHHPTGDMSAEARRQSIMAMDRKRRLTASTSDGGRRRYIPGSLHNRDDTSATRTLDIPSSSSRPMHRHHRSNSSHVQTVAEVIDLTSSPLAPNPPSSLVPRPSPSSSTRVYTIPRWQSDSDAHECPICKRQFGLFFRRHHCRKCGRVVCNDCSPHRITIPRQFIVNPPGTADLPVSPVTETVDLTGDDDDDEEDDHQMMFSSLHRNPNALIEGGEKVRLCNTCVTLRFGNVRDPANPTRSRQTGSSWREIMQVSNLIFEAFVPQVSLYHGTHLQQPLPSIPTPNNTSLIDQYQHIARQRQQANSLEPNPFVPSLYAARFNFEVRRS
jgi:hypothetical protein